MKRVLSAARGAQATSEATSLPAGVQVSSAAKAGLFPAGPAETLTRLPQLLVVSTGDDFEHWSSNPQLAVVLVPEFPRRSDIIETIRDRCYDVVVAVDNLRLGQDLAAAFAYGESDGPDVYTIDQDSHALLRRHDLPDLIAVAEPWGRDNGAYEDERTVWSGAQSVDALLREPDEDFEYLIPGFLVPECVTTVVAPAGSGKTQLAMAMVVALSKGSRFLGADLKRRRVLYLDRDNPKQVLRKRFRSWGATGCGDFLKYMSRDEVPPLTDRAAWKTFPVGDFDVIVVDSFGSFSEGVEDKHAGGTSRILAPILDVARKNAAVLLLDNTGKSGVVQRGSGIKRDRADIVCEVRDATEVAPTGGEGGWWNSLPEPSEAAWGERAFRRKKQERIRLGVVYSKFRLGEEPEPFAVEIRMPDDAPWVVADVTGDMVALRQRGVEAARAQAEKRLQEGARLLAAEVKARQESGRPMQKTEAEDFLRKQADFTRREAREQIEAGHLFRWEIRAERAPGSPQRLYVASAGKSAAA